VVVGVVALEPLGDAGVASLLVGVEHRVDVVGAEFDGDGALAGVALPSALGALHPVGGQAGALPVGEPGASRVECCLASLLRRGRLAGLGAKGGEVVGPGLVALLPVLPCDPALDAALGDTELLGRGTCVRASALGGAEGRDD